MRKTALVTGVSGQDGSYLAKFLLEKGYTVYGSHRRNASGSLWRLDALSITNDVKLIDLELTEFFNIMRVIERVKPDEIYNLAAQSFVKASFDQPIYTTNVDALAVAYLLETIRTLNPEIKIYQASSSEMFGKVESAPQNEQTPFRPRSPYAIAKLYGHWMIVNYREAYDIFACSGILFNHESPLRGLEFVTRKITKTLADIKCGNAQILELGNIHTQRDWGFAGEYVRGMWLMLQQDAADDYVLGTGESHSIKEFVDVAARYAGFELEWEGSDVKEIAVDRKSGKTLVRINPEFFRPAEVDCLRGDSTKARQKLGWTPTVTFEKLIEIMMKADLDQVRRG